MTAVETTTESKVTLQVELWFYNPPTNDKVWGVSVYGREDGSAVMHRKWGRRGTELSQMIEEFSTVGQARSKALGLIASKERKGYTRTHSKVDAG